MFVRVFFSLIRIFSLRTRRSAEKNAPSATGAAPLHSPQAPFPEEEAERWARPSSGSPPGAAAPLRRPAAPRRPKGPFEPRGRSRGETRRGSSTPLRSRQPPRPAHSPRRLSDPPNSARAAAARAPAGNSDRISRQSSTRVPAPSAARAQRAEGAGRGPRSKSRLVCPKS